MERWHMKLTAGLIIVIAILFCALLPICVYDSLKRRGKKGQQILAALVCFSGGVFLGVYILHLGPEAKELLTVNWLEPEHIDYPVTEALIGAGFFAFFLIEKLVHCCNRTTAAEDRELVKQSNVQCRRHSSVKALKVPSSAYEAAIIDTEAYDGRKMLPISEESGNGVSKKGVAKRDYGTTVGGKGQQENEIRALIITLALSLDSILEGISLGLQETTAGVWKLFVGIITHEVVLAFAIGIQVMSTTGSRRRVALTAAIYSITGAVGVAIGTSVYETQGESTTIGTVSGILQALTAGVFIFIIFCEILEEHLGKDEPVWKLGFMFLGFVVMAALSAVPHDHGDDHSHDVGHDQDHGDGHIHEELYEDEHHDEHDL